MKKTISAMFIVILAVVVLINVQDVKTQSADKPLQGKVLSLRDYYMDGKGVVTQARAKELVDNNQPLIFKSGNKVYFILNEDGSYAGKKLANYVNADNVGIIGKTQTKYGVNFIIASAIHAM